MAAVQPSQAGFVKFHLQPRFAIDFIKVSTGLYKWTNEESVACPYEESGTVYGWKLWITASCKWFLENLCTDSNSVKRVTRHSERE